MIVAICSAVISIGGAILAAVNHTRIRSVCCGKKLEVSLDVEKTTPPPSVKLAEIEKEQVAV